MVAEEAIPKPTLRAGFAWPFLPTSVWWGARACRSVARVPREKVNCWEREFPTTISGKLSPSLKKGVRVNADSTGAVLVDTDLCRTVRLQTMEAKILELCDGKRGPEEIVAECAKSGIVCDLQLVQGVVSHFEEEGFLKTPIDLSEVEIEVDIGDEKSAASRQTAGESPLLSDQVPRLRADLQIQKRSTGELGLMDVSDPRSGRTFTLYDFEVSIARMLNGERKIVDVIEAAAKIGIPVTLESFQKFIRQIRAYGFVDDTKPAETSHDNEGQTSWEPREEWSDEVRQHFQSALKMFRLKRLAEAKNYAEVILSIDPKNEEARDMLKRIDQSPGSLEAVVATAETTTDPVEAPPNFEDLYGKTAPSKEVAPARDYRTRTAERAAHRTVQLRTRILAGVALLLLVGVVGFYPFPHVLSVDARIRPILDLPLRAPRAGTVRALFAHERQWVTVGTKLLELDTRSVLQRLEGVEKSLERASRELKDWESAKQSPDFVRLLALSQALHQELENMNAQRENLGANRGAKATRLAKRIAAAEAALRRSTEEMERIAPQSRQPELSSVIENTEKERAQLKAEIEKASIVAPHEGVVVGLPEARSEVTAGQILARVQDISLLKATLKVSEGDAHLLEQEQRVYVSAPNLPRQEFKGHVSFVAEPDQTEGNFQAIVTNPEKLTLDVLGKATILCGKQSFAQRMMNRVKRLTMPSLQAALK